MPKDEPKEIFALKSPKTGLYCFAFRVPEGHLSVSEMKKKTSELTLSQGETKKVPYWALAIVEEIMATIILKNIPDPTYAILKQIAAENHRSINSEIIHLIEKATKSTRIDPDQHVAAARALREKTKGYVVDDIALSDL